MPDDIRNPNPDQNPKRVLRDGETLTQRFTLMDAQPERHPWLDYRDSLSTLWMQQDPVAMKSPDSLADHNDRNAADRAYQTYVQSLADAYKQEPAA